MPDSVLRELHKDVSDAMDQMGWAEGDKERMDALWCFVQRTERMLGELMRREEERTSGRLNSA